jgi:hypothetical protein
MEPQNQSKRASARLLRSDSKGLMWKIFVRIFGQKDNGLLRQHMVQ